MENLMSQVEEVAQGLCEDVCFRWADGHKRSHNMSYWRWSDAHTRDIQTYCGGAGWDRAMLEQPETLAAYQALLDSDCDDEVAAFDRAVHQRYIEMLDEAHNVSKLEDSE